MTGNLSSQMGDMACAATRRKDKIQASRLAMLIAWPRADVLPAR